MIAIGRARFVEPSAGGRKRAGGERAGEDETLQPEPFAGVEQQAGAVDVGALVLRMLAAGEVVVRGEVQQGRGAAGGAQLGKELPDRARVREIEAVPADVPPAHERSGIRRLAIDRLDPPAVGEPGDQSLAEKAGRTGEHQAGAGVHRPERVSAGSAGPHRPAGWELSAARPRMAA
jgi:hypothetical protein